MMSRLWQLITLPYRYAHFRWVKWKLRKSFGPWLQWSLGLELKKEILQTGWAEKPIISVNRYPTYEPQEGPKVAHSRRWDSRFEELDMKYY